MHRLKQATVCVKCSGFFGEQTEGEPRSQTNVQTGLVRPLVLKHCVRAARRSKILQCFSTSPQPPPLYIAFAPPPTDDLMYSCSRVRPAQFVLLFLKCNEAYRRTTVSDRWC